MRKMKKVLSGIIAGSMIMTGCIGMTASAEEQGSYKVAYIARTLSDPFAAWLATEIETQAEENYSDLFTVDVLDAQGDSEKTNSLIETCITKKYDCVIIQPNDGELQRPYAEKLIDAGIFCITTNAKIPDLEGSSSVDADPYEQGAVLARDAAERVPENGKVVLLNCNPGNLHATKRYEAFQKEFLEKRPDVTVLGDKILERASEADAMATMEDWVQSFGKFDAIITTADILSLGALEVVKDNPDFDDLLVYGVDGLSAALLAIKDGDYTATCLQSAIQLAELNLKTASQLLKGEEEIVEYSIDAVLIDASNVDEYIELYIENGQLDADEVAQH